MNIGWAAVAMLVGLSAACGDDDSEGESGESSAAPTAGSAAPSTSDAPSTSTRSTEETTTVPSASPPRRRRASEWVVQDAPEDCVCADGTPFTFWSRTDDPERVVLYFQGGGACFSAETCSFTNGSFDSTIGPGDDPSDSEGIFDFDNPDNPFAGWSAVFVPYCTGDVHIGDATTVYSPELTIEHNGYPNAYAALDFLVENHPDASRVVVAGSSAGGIPSPLFGGLVSDQLPEADIAVLADASGGYQSDPGLNGLVGALWGTGEHIPDWPETSGIPQEEYGVPDLFVYAGRHDPGIRMARFDRAWDDVQRSFAAAIGMSAVPLPDVLDQNEAMVETAGVELSVYVAPGEDHVLLETPDVYTLSVGGVTFLDWLTRLVEGDVPGDVRCVECQAPASTTTTG